MQHRVRARRGLSTWLADTTTPVFVLDERRRVLFFNAGCVQLTGWQAGDVIGQVCDFVSEPDSTQIESLTGALCPPPEVYEGHEHSVALFVQSRSGEKLSRLARFVPLMTAEGKVDRVLGTFSTIPAPGTSTGIVDREPHAEIAALRSDLWQRYHVSTVVGCSRSFHRLMQQVQLACRHASSVHFSGEGGTGKEHLARLVHYQGDARRQAFVPLDCRRLTREEIKLAVREVLRDTREQQATRLSPGTLFLKHVDELPDSVQDLLLEEQPSTVGVQTNGASKQNPNLALRLMSSSEGDLHAAVDRDKLHADIYCLLTSQQIAVPSLRERPDDILLIAQHCLESLNRDQEQQVTGFADNVVKAFRKYNWPGNQDELKAVVTEARQACDQSTIRLCHLPFRFRAGQEAQMVGPPPPVEIIPLEDRLADVEREHIELALRQAGDNKSQAAASLGITRARLYRRLEQLGLKDSD